MSEKCTSCGEEFKRLGMHWSQSKCGYPELTEIQRQILTGLLMGDGTLHTSESRKPYISTAMTNKPYLEHLDEIMGRFSTGVSLKHSAEEKRDKDTANGANQNPDIENYSHLYHWQTRRNTKLDIFKEWYKSGDKLFPEKLQLTPTILKHWYVCDGHLNKNTGKGASITISMSNERENTDKIDSYFKEADLPTPTWNITDNSCNARWTTKESEKLFAYMGEHVEGFRYKWRYSYDD